MGGPAAGPGSAAGAAAAGRTSAAPLFPAPSIYKIVPRGDGIDFIGGQGDTPIRVSASFTGEAARRASRRPARGEGTQ